MGNSETVFLLLILISNILISGSLYPLIYIVAALLHECGHLLTIYAFGYGKADIKFVGIGIRIKNKCVFSYRQEIIIGSMGPITNLAFGALGLILFMINQSTVLSYFVVANMLYAVINLVPLAPLDGFKILSNALYLYLPYPKVKMILKTVTAILSGILLFLLLLMLFYNYLNLSFLLILIVLIANAFLQLFCS